MVVGKVVCYQPTILSLARPKEANDSFTVKLLQVIPQNGKSQNGSVGHNHVWCIVVRIRIFLWILVWSKSLLRVK